MLSGFRQPSQVREAFEKQWTSAGLQPSAQAPAPPRATEVKLERGADSGAAREEAAAAAVEAAPAPVAAPAVGVKLELSWICNYHNIQLNVQRKTLVDPKLLVTTVHM